MNAAQLRAAASRYANWTSGDYDSSGGYSRDTDERALAKAMCLRLAADEDERRELARVAGIDVILMGLRDLDADQLRAIYRRDTNKLLDRLCDIGKAFVPQPDTLPGWDDDGCEREYAERIRLACKWHGVDEPEHITEILKGGAQ